MKRFVTSALVIALSACSSAGTGDDSFGSQRVATTTSSVCNANLDAYAAPDPLTRGASSIKFVATDVTTSAPRDGLSIALVPWMPAMGHGASTVPTVTAQGGGVYVARDVVLIMPGTWQLRVQLSGACSDNVVLSVEVQ